MLSQQVAKGFPPRSRSVAGKSGRLDRRDTTDIRAWKMRSTAFVPLYTCTLNARALTRLRCCPSVTETLRT